MNPTLGDFASFLTFNLIGTGIINSINVKKLFFNRMRLKLVFIKGSQIFIYFSIYFQSYILLANTKLYFAVIRNII